jgi:hypothetical protein
MLANVEHVGRARKIGNNTVRYTRPNGDDVIRLHRTDIVTRKPDGSVILNSGGWRTVTTKARLNEYVSSVAIYQKDHEWFICNRGDWAGAIPFEDGCTVNASGRLEQ